MARTRLTAFYVIALTEEEREAWHAAARRRDQQLSKLIRRAVREYFGLDANGRPTEDTGGR
jgi:hypothetical protein